LRPASRRIDLVLVETSGIGQGDSGVVPLVDASLYVMTPGVRRGEQLEKIECSISDSSHQQFRPRAARTRLRDVRKQVQRTASSSRAPPKEMPVYGTSRHASTTDGRHRALPGILVALAGTV